MIAAGVTVGRLWMAYKSGRPRGRAFQGERNLMKPFVLRFWRRPAQSITRADWEEHRRRRRTEPTRTGKPPRDVTLNMELKSARRMFTSSVSEERLAKNPLRDCKPVKTRERRESWFTAEQIQALIDGSTSLRWRHQQLAFAAIATVMGDTGLRISEALGLRWDRITRDGTTSVLGKGSKTRVIGFTPRALAAMRLLDRHANPHVFINWSSGAVFNATTVRVWFKTAIAVAGLEGVKADGDLALVPHNLRHSFASIADERGTPPGWIQHAMGHSHASTTAVYLHRNDADAARRMAAIMAGRKPARRRPSRAAMPTVDAGVA